MKTTTKFSKAVLIALLAAGCAVTSVSLAACDNDTPSQTTEAVITRYEAAMDASITMGPMGTYNLGESIVAGTYVTEQDGNYKLTLVFKTGELTVAGIQGEVFVDDNPVNPTTTNGLTDGTIGFYKEDGTLVTDGITVTYSSGDNYAANVSGENVYYVQSAELPVDGLRETYDLTLYINSAMMGKQFSKETYPASVTLDLNSGEVVTSVSGLGVSTLGTVPGQQPDEKPEEKPDEKPEEKPEPDTALTKYEATLDAVVNMGGSNVNFTENLIDSVYAVGNDDGFEITVTFKTGNVNMPYGNLMTGYMNGTPSVDYFGEEVIPQYGYYNGEELVTDGVVLTYSTGDDYVTTKNGSFYYVKSMSFTVEELSESINLAVYICAYNASAVSGMQFPYTSNSGAVTDAVLSIDLESGEEVAEIGGLGVSTLGTVPSEQPEAAYTKYEATLDAVVNMGGSNVNFTENLIDSVYVTENENGFDVTLTFKTGNVNMPYGNLMTGYMNGTPSVDYFGEEVVPQYGYFDGEELATDVVVLTYSTGDDYVTTKNGSFHYVKSMTFTVDELSESFNLAVYICAYNASAVSGMQFPYTSNSGVVTDAVLTIDLDSGVGVDEISGLGVDTLEEVEA